MTQAKGNSHNFPFPSTACDIILVNSCLLALANLIEGPWQRGNSKFHQLKNSLGTEPLSNEQTADITNKKLKFNIRGQCYAMFTLQNFMLNSVFTVDGSRMFIMISTYEHDCVPWLRRVCRFGWRQQLSLKNIPGSWVHVLGRRHFDMKHL